MRTQFLAIALLILVPGSARCGSDDFRGQPADQRKTFPVTEFGLRAKVNQSSWGTDGAPDIKGQWDFGLMAKVSRRYAIGGSFFAALSAATQMHTLDVGIAARLTRWLDHGFSIDVSPGLALMNMSLYENSVGAESIRGPSFTGSVRLSYKRCVALVASVDVLTKSFSRTGPSYEKTLTTFYLGVTAQSGPGIVTGVVAAVACVAVMAAGAAALSGGW